MKYCWMSLRSAEAGDRKKISFIAPSNGFADAKGQVIIKNRIKLLAKLGFEVHFPVFAEVASEEREIVLDARGGSEKFNALTNVLIEPDLHRNSSLLLDSVSPAVSVENGAWQIIESIESKRDIMPLLGGDKFEDKLLRVKKHFSENPKGKDPSVRIFGYSNASWASALMIEGICSYVPTQYTAHFLRREEVRVLKAENKSNGYLEYIEHQANRLEECLLTGKIENFSRPLIYAPESIEKKEDFVMHYPLNSGVIAKSLEDSDRFEFKPKPEESWSFGVEFMMQQAVDVSRFNQIPSLAKEFLKANESHPPKFMEIGCIGSRLDGFLGIADLIHDERNGDAIVDGRNVDKILSGKEKLVEHLNRFLSKYAQLRDDEFLEKKDKDRHGELPPFLRSKQMITSEDVNSDQVKELLKWQNEIRGRIIAEFVELARECKLPLFFNPRFGHVANMSPIQSGPCKYSIQESGLILESATRDKCLIAPATAIVATTVGQSFQEDKCR